MPLSSFSEQYAMYDVTPVENLFLLEYMPYAPGDYAKDEEAAESYYEEPAEVPAPAEVNAISTPLKESSCWRRRTVKSRPLNL